MRERRAKGSNSAPGGLALLCLVLLTVTGCAGDDTGSATAPVTEVPTAAAIQPVDLEELVWAGGIDPATSAPVDRREAFPRDAQMIHAVVRTGPLPAGTTLTARWTFNGQPVEGADVTVTATDPHDAGWVEFHLEWTGGGLWPVGTLEVEVTAGAGESIAGSIEIVGT